MSNDDLKTMIFSKDSGFRDEFIGRLKCVGIEDTLSADDMSAVGELVVPGMRGVVIYDTLSGDEIMKRFIGQSRISERDYFCIYVCSQDYDGIYAKPFFNYLRLERPYSLHEFYMTFFYASHELCKRSGSSQGGFSETLVSIASDNLLKRIGVPVKLKGFEYLKSAICAVVSDPAAIELITKNLYIDIAREHNTSACCAERAMRNAVEIAWKRGFRSAISMLYGDFGFAFRRPPNTDFILCSAEIIRRRLSTGDFTIN